MNRSIVVVAALLATLNLAGRCKGPKKPKSSEAAELVEQAYGGVDVEAELERHDAIDVEVALASEDSVVHFERVQGETQATVLLDDETHLFVISADGEAKEW